MTDEPFRLTPKQEELNRALAGDQLHFLAYGGGRSGKSFPLMRAMAVRAMRAERSRHVSLRFRFNHIKESLFLDTFPKMMRLCFPDMRYQLNKTDLFATFPNFSEVWFAGLDDKERTDKVLGKEFATIFFNECSQIPWASVETAHTRLAQKTGLKLRAYYDENPPKKSHWSYKLFILKVDPISGMPLAEPNNYGRLQMNPEDNAENLAPETLSIYRNLSGARRKRFYEGEFSDANPDALFADEVFDRNRVLDGRVPDFQRVVVAIDPSGASDDEGNEGDPIGIVVAALGTDQRAYILEDLTLKAGPKTWGGVAVGAHDRHEADLIVGEVNFGGAMVGFVVRAAATDPERPKRSRDVAFKMVTASRGKVVRAEPISYLVSDGKVRHVGHFPELEEELTGFSKTGYTGSGSPNRADAYVWALTELFPGITASKADADKVPLPSPALPNFGPQGWLAG